MATGMGLNISRLSSHPAGGRGEVAGRRAGQAQGPSFMRAQGVGPEREAMDTAFAVPGMQECERAAPMDVRIRDGHVVEGGACVGPEEEDPRRAAMFPV